MAPICSNPNCSNIKRVEGDVCPECGSPAKDMGFKEGTSMIKLKKETMNQIEAKSQEIPIPEIDDKVDDQVDDVINTAEDEPKPDVINTSEGINSPILKILVFIGVVIVFYILFTSLF
jgi:hypothetical protein